VARSLPGPGHSACVGVRRQLWDSCSHRIDRLHCVHPLPCVGGASRGRRSPRRPLNRPWRPHFHPV